MAFQRDVKEQQDKAAKEDFGMVLSFEWVDGNNQALPQADASILYA